MGYPELLRKLFYTSNNFTGNSFLQQTILTSNNNYFDNMISFNSMMTMVTDTDKCTNPILYDLFDQSDYKDFRM